MRNILCYALIMPYVPSLSGVHKMNTPSWFSVSERFIYETPPMSSISSVNQHIT